MSWDARVCSGEGDQAELNIVADQAPTSLGLAPKRGLCEDSNEESTCKPFQG